MFLRKYTSFVFSLWLLSFSGTICGKWLGAKTNIFYIMSVTENSKPRSRRAGKRKVTESAVRERSKPRSGSARRAIPPLTRKRLVAKRDLFRKGGAAERVSFRTPAEANDAKLVTTRRGTTIARQRWKGTRRRRPITLHVCAKNSEKGKACDWIGFSTEHCCVCRFSTSSTASGPPSPHRGRHATWLVFDRGCSACSSAGGRLPPLPWLGGPDRVLCC